MTTTAALGVLLAVLLFLTAYPMAMLVYGSLHTAPPGEIGAFSLDGYRAMLSGGNALTLLNTVGLSLVKTVLSMALALFLAWIVARTDTPYERVVSMLALIPLDISKSSAWAGTAPSRAIAAAMGLSFIDSPL